MVTAVQDLLKGIELLGSMSTKATKNVMVMDDKFMTWVDDKDVRYMSGQNIFGTFDSKETLVYRMLRLFGMAKLSLNNFSIQPESQCMVFNIDHLGISVNMHLESRHSGFTSKWGFRVMLVKSALV